MPDRLVRATPLAIVIAVLLAIAPGATLAQDDDTAVDIAGGINADRVDGRHAVGAGASKAARANKLVATNGAGLLPSNILKPLWDLIQGIPDVLADGQVSWAEVTGKPAGFADGVDNGGFASTTMGPYSVNGIGGSAAVVYDASPDVDVKFSVIPVTDQGDVEVQPLTVKRIGASLRHRFVVKNYGLGTVQVKFRILAYSQGISPAALEQQLNNATIVVVTRKGRK